MKYIKDIVAFDLETTGLDKNKDSIIQFAGVKFNVDDSGNIVIIDKLNLYIRPIGNYTIPLASFLVHHISPKFLADKPTILEVGKQIVDFIGDCDLLTFNGNSFDIPFLTARLKAVNIDFNATEHSCYDSFKEEKRRNGNTLGECYKRYNNGKSMEDNELTAHDAYSDVMATIDIFDKQQSISKFNPETMYDPDGMFEYKDFQGEMCPCFAFGKYRNISLKYINQFDPSYITWVLGNDAFHYKTKEFIKKNI